MRDYSADFWFDLTPSPIPGMREVTLMLYAVKYFGDEAPGPVRLKNLRPKYRSRLLERAQHAAPLQMQTIQMWPGERVEQERDFGGFG